MNDVIKQAYEIVKVLGEQYKTKNELYYLQDDDGDEINPEASYCEDCIDDASIEFDACYQIESMPEYEDFKYCESCGEIIETSRLFSEPEIKHQIENFEFNERNCFEVMCILDETYGAIEEHEELCIELAKQIILKNENKR